MQFSGHFSICIQKMNLIYKINVFLKFFYRKKNINTILKNSIWIISDKILRLLIGLIIGAWVARYLGPKLFGTLSYVVSYITLFQAFASFGIDAIVVRDLTKEKHESGKIIASSFFLKFISGIVAWLAAIILMGINNGFNSQVILLTTIVGSSIIFQSSECFDLWFQSQSQSKKTFVSKLIAYLFTNFLKVIFILNNAPLYAFAILISLEALLIGITLFFSFLKFPTDSKLSISKKFVFSLIREGWPLMLSSLFVAIYMRIDQIMIKNFIGENKLGIYSAILPLSNIWQFIPISLGVSLAPFVTKAKNESEESYWKMLDKIFSVFSILAWIVIIPTVFFSKFIINLLYGNQYLEGATILAIYIFTNLFINLGVAQNLWLINDNKVLISLYKTLIAAVFSLICNLVFIPKFGLIGAAIIAVLSQGVSAIFSNIFFSKKILKLQLRSIFYPIFIFRKKTI